MFRLFPCPGYCKEYCNEHWGTCVILNYGFLTIYAQLWDCWVIWTGSGRKRNPLALLMMMPVDNSHCGEQYAAAAAAAKSLQLYPTLCDPIDSSPPGSPILGILQTRTLEWVAISFSAWKWKVKLKSHSRVRLLTTPWTAAYQTPPSMGFSRQQYWSRVPLPSP